MTPCTPRSVLAIILIGLALAAGPRGAEAQEKGFERLRGEAIAKLLLGNSLASETGDSDMNCLFFEAYDPFNDIGTTQKEYYRWSLAGLDGVPDGDQLTIRAWNSMSQGFKHRSFEVYARTDGAVLLKARFHPDVKENVIPGRACR